MGLIFTDEQMAIRQTVMTTDRNLIVDAKSGTGKTTVLTKVIAPVIHRQGDVLMLAFNVGIAASLGIEMSGTGVVVRTSNAFGNEALRRAFPGAEFDKDKYRKLYRDTIRIARREERIGTLRVQGLHEVLREDSRVDKRVSAYSAMRSLVELCMTTLTDPNDTEGLRVLNDVYTLEIQEHHWSYLRLAVPHIIETGLGMLSESRHYLDQVFAPVWLDLPMSKFDVVMVDECQDLSRAQIEMVFKALQPGGRVIAVGDKRQAIFAFAGADSRSYEHLIERTNALVLPLNTCFRCSKRVIREAQKIVPEIQARPGAPEGSIQSVTKARFLAGVKNGDMVLCRVNRDLIETCFELIKQGRPAYVMGRDLDEKVLRTLYEVSKQHGFRWSKMDEFITQWSNYRVAAIREKNPEDPDELAMEMIRDRAEVLRIFYKQGARSEAELEDIIREFFSRTDQPIQMATIHKIKGLEATRVWILRPDLLPFPGAKGVQKIQEMNLKYVAITRAKEDLFFVERSPQEGPPPRNWRT